MELYVVYKNHSQEIMAISEDEPDIIQYMNEKSFTPAEYSIAIVDGPIANSMMINHDDLFLEHDPETDMVMTRTERAIVTDILETERERITGVVQGLEHIVRNYKLGKKEKKILLKAHETLVPKTTNNKLRKMLQLKKFNKFLTRGKHLTEVFTRRKSLDSEKMYIFTGRND